MLTVWLGFEQERKSALKIQKLAKMELEQREKDGDDKEEAELEVLDSINKAKERTSLFSSRESYK